MPTEIFPAHFLYIQMCGDACKIRATLIQSLHMSNTSELEQPENEPSTFSPVPSMSSIQRHSLQSRLVPVTCDHRAIAGLLETMMSRAGLTTAEMARRMGVTPNGVGQYIAGRRTKPSLQWFVRFAELCGVHVKIEYPNK